MSELIGYVFDEKIIHENKYYFEESLDNITDFILTFSNCKITLTDKLDLLVMKIDKCVVLDCCDCYKIENVHEAIFNKLRGNVDFSIMEFVQTEQRVMQMKK